jgi:hypothetical protein
MRDDRKMMTMTEDYWFPRREGNRSTEVETLPGGGGLGENENLQYFQRRLYKALNVPVARLEPETMYTFGRGSEVTREELKFSKFVRRIRTRFSILFDKCLEKQLILKGVIEPDDWKEIQDHIRYDFMKDNYFEELKQAEILKEKMATLREVEEHVGTYYSRNWVRKNVLFLNDDDIKEMQKEMDKEKKEEPDEFGDDDGGDDGDGNAPNPFAKKKEPADEKPDGETEKESFAKDGNNFGVSIQEDTLGEIRTVEAEAAAFYEQISRYFLSRGKIISKVNNLHLYSTMPVRMSNISFNNLS